MIDRSDITGIILCGGQGARLGGLDKPLIDLGGSRILDCMIEGLRSHVGSFILSCSRNVALYEAIGHLVVVDVETARGPLAGLTESFGSVATEWALTMPGDIPCIQGSIVSGLDQSARQHGVAVPSVSGVRQNLCLLLNKERRDQLKDFYEHGGRAVKQWLNQLGIQSCDFSANQKQFLNVNTEEELLIARSWFARRNAQ